MGFRLIPSVWLSWLQSCKEFASLTQKLRGNVGKIPSRNRPGLLSVSAGALLLPMVVLIILRGSEPLELPFANTLSFFSHLLTSRVAAIEVGCPGGRASMCLQRGCVPGRCDWHRQAVPPSRHTSIWLALMLPSQTPAGCRGEVLEHPEKLTERSLLLCRALI